MVLHLSFKVTWADTSRCQPNLLLGSRTDNWSQGTFTPSVSCLYRHAIRVANDLGLPFSTAFVIGKALLIIVSNPCRATLINRGEIAPLLSNLYLTEVDRMLERAKTVTRRGKYTYLEYARFADAIVILIDAYPQHDWLLGAVDKRLREELALLHVTLNEAKSRIVDLANEESFGFLGFDFRRVRTRSGKWRAHYAPRMKKRTALLQKLKTIFRRFQSQPVSRVIQLINPILQGWVKYFAIGESCSLLACNRKNSLSSQVRPFIAKMSV